MENYSSLLAISPIDGRYKELVRNLSNYFSEYALIKYRVKIEIDWLIFLLKLDEINKSEDDFSTVLEQIVNCFDEKEAEIVKDFEKTTNHDVKAVEYYVRKKLEEKNIEKYSQYVHFACTSEDINNLAYGRMITDFINDVFLEKCEELISTVKKKSKELSNIPMLSHTHGQPATPTTVGKELAIFAYRWETILDYIKKTKLRGKFSGAVGNFNSHIISYPNIDWINECRRFVIQEGLEFNILTTQIESHDILCILLNYIKSFNNIIMDFNSDMWMYISNEFFNQKIVKTETGSSIMPHKVNPINHENSMANIRIANSIIDSLCNNLQVSRMQRDLSDSSMLRNIGVIFAHTCISISQTIKGFNKMKVNSEKLKEELNKNSEVLAEAIQTVLRKNGYKNAYEVLKDFSRGNKHTLEEYREFIKQLDIDEEDKNRLLELTPEKYIGLAEKLCNLL